MPFNSSEVIKPDRGLQSLTRGICSAGKSETGSREWAWSVVLWQWAFQKRVQDPCHIYPGIPGILMPPVFSKMLFFILTILKCDLLLSVRQGERSLKRMARPDDYCGWMNNSNKSSAVRKARSFEGTLPRCFFYALPADRVSGCRSDGQIPEHSRSSCWRHVCRGERHDAREKIGEFEPYVSITLKNPIFPNRA